MVLAAVVMSQALYAESLRPQFHFTAKSGWLNDPNGLVYFAGEYHLFFQHNPTGNEWGNMTWGHAVSEDLVHWRQLSNAIEPDEHGTIYSGSAVVDSQNTSGLNADLIALFTAAGGQNEASKGKPFTQRLAYSRDRGRTWTKLSKPVLGHLAGENRDPKVAWHEASKRWVMALYLEGEVFALFVSPDLQNWKETQRFTMPGSSECPDFFEMSVRGSKVRKWVFTGANGRYWVGSFEGGKFHPETPPRQVEFGGNNYAVQTYFGLPNDRRVQIGWMNGGKYPGMPFNQQMTFPCELTLRRTEEGLSLFRYPVKEIERLWMPVSSDADLLDLNLDFEAGDEMTRLQVNGQVITYDPAVNILSALGRHAYLAPERGRVRLRVLLDRTSLEVFGNDGRVSLSTCMAPSTQRGIELRTSYPARAKLVSHGLRSAW